MDYLKKFSLAGRVAFVAGGAGLIGSEVSKALANAGALTVILDTNRERGRALETDIREQGDDASYEYLDITNQRAVEKRLARLASKHGGMDVWVNAAYPKTKDWGADVEGVSIDSLRKNVDLHLNSSVWASRSAALLMKKKRIRGSIVNFGSIYGIQGNDFTVYEGTRMTSPMAYSAIKGGILNATRYLASYFGKYGIRVNNVCPGGIYDRQNRRFVRNYEQKVPLRRMGRPEEIGTVVLFLASEASAYITGATLVVDGGWTIV